MPLTNRYVAQTVKTMAWTPGASHHVSRRCVRPRPSAAVPGGFIGVRSGARIGLRITAMVAGRPRHVAERRGVGATGRESRF